MTPHEKAQLGLKQIEEAVIELLRLHGDWMSYPDIVRKLGMDLDYEGGHGYYLSRSICTTLVDRGIFQSRVEVGNIRGRTSQTTFYRITNSN